MGPHSDSEDEGIDDNDFDNVSDGEDDVDEDILDALEGDLAAAAAAEEASDGDEDSDTEDTDGSDDDDLHYDAPPPPPEPSRQTEVTSIPPSKLPSPQARTESPPERAPSPARKRSVSPAQARKDKILTSVTFPKAFTVEAICAIPHPVSTHALAASLCMTHMITGSDDGYIRDYDVFAAVNGKVFLTAPQRHHCGVMEGLLRSVPLKCWWENPPDMSRNKIIGEEHPPCAPYSLLMHSDALWALAGSDQGHINLFTVRHDPGRLCFSMPGHRGPVSALAMQHDEKGFFSAGWDGEAYQWDLNTGQVVRNFAAHGAQLAAIAVKPLISNFRGYHWDPPPPTDRRGSMSGRSHPTGDANGSAGNPTPNIPQLDVAHDEDTKSDTSFDPLFDDEPDAEGVQDRPPASIPAPSATISDHSITQKTQPSTQPGTRSVSTVAPPKGAPPILDPVSYASFSADVLMTASVDGQIILWDQRVHSPGTGVGRLWMSEKTPPWCVSACWSADGGQIYAGRRTGTIDVYDVRNSGRSAMGAPRILKTLRNPASSGVVSCVVAFPDGRHLACASNDNLRLWNVAEAGEPDVSGKMKTGVQFKIIPGHHGGFISQMLVDPAARFLVSASSNRGWHGESTRTVFVHEIKHLW